MPSSRTLSRARIILVCAVLGASAGVCWQALRITGRPQEFCSMAKVLAGPSMTSGYYSSVEHTKALAPLFEAIVKALESSDLEQRAAKRVGVLHPEPTSHDVKTQISHTTGSHIFLIQTIGSDPKYVRIYLDALLDEFIADSQPLQEQYDQLSPGEMKPAINVQERATPAFEIMEDWQLPIAIGALGGGFLGAVLGLLLSLILVRSPAPVS
jgi:hypothetical protein